MFGLSRRDRQAQRDREVAEAREKSIKAMASLGVVERQVGELRRASAEFTRLAGIDSTTEKQLVTAWRAMVAERKRLAVAKEEHASCSAL